MLEAAAARVNMRLKYLLMTSNPPMVTRFFSVSSEIRQRPHDAMVNQMIMF